MFLVYAHEIKLKSFDRDNIRATVERCGTNIAIRSFCSTNNLQASSENIFLWMFIAKKHLWANCGYLCQIENGFRNSIYTVNCSSPNEVPESQGEMVTVVVNTRRINFSSGRRGRPSIPMFNATQIPGHVWHPALRQPGVKCKMSDWLRRSASRVHAHKCYWINTTEKTTQ